MQCGVMATLPWLAAHGGALNKVEAQEVEVLCATERRQATVGAAVGGHHNREPVVFFMAQSCVCGTAHDREKLG